MYNSSNKRGFSLLELLIALAILSIIVLLALSRYVDSTRDSKIRVFEMNSRTIISEINTKYAEQNGSKDKVYDIINPMTISLNGRPEHSTYSIDKSTNVLTCTLKSEAFGGKEDYIIKYEPNSKIITQEPYGVDGKDLIPGATNLQNK